MSAPIAERRDGERGFTLIETLIATTIIVLIAMAALQATLLGMKSIGAIQKSGAMASDDGVNRFAERLRSEARASFAVDLTSDFPVLPGKPTFPIMGQVLFFGRDDQGVPAAWSYGTVGAQVIRYDYGSTLDPRAATGPNASVSAPAVQSTSVVPGIAAIDVTRIEADELGRDDLNPGYAALFRNVQAKCLDAPAAASATTTCGATFGGGNHVVAMTLHGAQGNLTVHLAGGAMPSNFTITAAPYAHVVLYRLDTIHRTWLGLAQYTLAQVFGSVSVHFATDAPGHYVPWCPQILLHDKMRVNNTIFESQDRFIDPQPNDPSERPSHVMALCMASHATPPPLNARPAVGIVQPPDTFDTPPPGATVPAGYTPPPGVVAPPGYCAANAGKSPLCSAGGAPLGVATPPPIFGPVPAQPTPIVIYVPWSPPPNTNVQGGG